MARARSRSHPDMTGDKRVLPLRGCLQEYLDNSGISFLAAHPDLHFAWAAIIGEELAQHAKVVGFKRGIIEVAVDSSSLMHEIQFHRAALLADLRAQIKKPFISRIVFRVTPKREENGAEEKQAKA